MGIIKLFTFKTYWGRYLIFSIFTLAFSLISLFVNVSSFPDQKESLLFLLIAPHFIYWGIYVFLSFERTFLRGKNEDRSRRKSSLNKIILMLVGTVLVIYNLYRVIFSLDFAVLPFVPIGTAILLAGYQDYHGAIDS